VTSLTPPADARPATDLAGPAAAGLALVVTLAVAFGPALAGMRATWDSTPMYSFGYIVPLISAFIIWRRRDILAGLRATPARVSGTVVVLAAAALLAGARLGGVQVVEQGAFLVALAGIVLLLWGHAVMHVVWFALAYLVLMVPFWEGLTEPLHLPFQQLSANLGIRMLQLVGIPSYREGLYLFLPNVTLEVARACSGVNYLVAILALGLPLGYLYLPTVWRRVLLLAMAIGVAAISNSLRVALIGVLSYLEIGSPLHGPGHVLHGVFVSGIGYVVLLIGLRVLSPKTPKTPPSSAAAAAPATPTDRVNLRAILPPARLALAASAVFAATAVFLAFYQPRPVPLANALANLPDRLGTWTTSGLGGSETWWSGADDELRRRYSRAATGPVDVAVAYFATQAQGRELAGQEAGRLHLAITADDVRLADGSRINAIRLKTLDGPRPGVFWYEIDGQPLTSPRDVKVRTTWNTLRHRRSNGTMVVLLGPTAPAAGPDDFGPLRELAEALHGALATTSAPRAAAHRP
jgi:EpsI family protein